MACMEMPSSLSLACAFLTRSFCLPAHSASSLPSRTYFMTRLHGQAPQKADPLGVEIALQMRVEELVVAQLVGGDVAADLLQHRLLRRLGERRVIGAGAGLDDAARDELAGARAAHRGAGAEVDAEARGEARRRRGVIEARIGQHGPAPQRLAVLRLLDAPAARLLLEGGIVMEDAAEILRVVGAVLLDQARRLDDAE